MSVSPFKRKDSVVKAVRRAATRQLDDVIEQLTRGGRPARRRSHDALQQLQALIQLVRRPLGREVFNREHRVINRALKQLAPPPDIAKRKALRLLVADKPKPEINHLLDSLTPDQPAPRRADQSADPKLLRLLADLAEVRMRARYWHLPDGGFELLTPGLRLSYQRAAKLSLPTASERDYAVSLTTLGHQLQLIQRTWPTMNEPYLEALDTARQAAERAAVLREVRADLKEHADVLPLLDAKLNKLTQKTTGLSPRLFAETGQAFLKRHQAYWDAWRG